jgi:sulfur-carrier protein adenylyltransferase/sulfurtransferase
MPRVRPSLRPGAISFARPPDHHELFSAMPDPLPELSPAELSRYSRHILLEQLGLAGQRRLAAARVLIVGAGGLGSPAALYLAAAGVGTIGLADLDRVEEHNLQRQLLHDTASIGEAKVVSAARRLRALNPHVTVIEHPAGITPTNAVEVFSGYDVIVDGTDNFSARYVNNDAAFFAQRPLVFGSVFKFEGQVAVFDPAHGSACYRCLFPQPPPAGSVPGCGEAGVLGAVCGVIGSMQALEAVKLITSIGTPLTGRLLTFDSLCTRMETLVLARNPACPLCGHAPSIRAPGSDPVTGALKSTSPLLPDDAAPAELPVSEAKRRLDKGESGSLLLDVREPWEIAIVNIGDAKQIPMRQIPERLTELPRDRHILVMCHHGGRSQRVAEYLRTRGFPRVSNVLGGIAAWAEEIDPSLPRY